MTGTVTSKAHLSVPAVEHQHFDTNFIRTAVCEARFPTLYDIDGPRPPAEFAHALRKEYPVHNLGQRVTMGGANQVDRTTAHVFTSRNARWTVNLTASTLSLETSRYDSFVDFEKRIGFLIDACQTFIDSDFFTRLGIRYINSLPYDRDRLTEWVNPALVQPLTNGTYGDVIECGQAIRGTTEAGLGCDRTRRGHRHARARPRAPDAQSSATGRTLRGQPRARPAGAAACRQRGAVQLVRVRRQQRLPRGRGSLIQSAYL